MAATQCEWEGEDVGEDVRDGGPHKRNYKLMFWKEDFSLLKFLYGKHRFVKFLGLERGGPRRAVSYFSRRFVGVCSKTNLLIPISFLFINMEAHLSLF